MILDKDDVNHIFDKWKYGLELEASIKTSIINQLGFRHVINTIKNHYHDEVLTENTQLDVSLIDEESYRKSNIRATFTDLNEIVKYCKKGIATPDLVISKSKKLKYFDTDYDFIIKLSQEDIIEKERYQDIMLSFKNKKKLFRLKKRYTIKINNYSFDFTVVKSIIRQSFKNISTDLKDKPETFEIELEYTGNTKPIVKDFQNKFLMIVKALSNDILLTPKSVKDKQAHSYIDMLLKNDYIKRSALKYKDKYNLFPKSFIIGTQPMTMELQHVDTVRQEGQYAITPKADGVRMMVFVNEIGDVFLINNRMNIFDTNIKVESAKLSLFDSEAVQNNNHTSIYLFECYIFKNKSQANKKLDQRLENIDVFLEDAKGNQYYTLKVKLHQPFTNAINFDEVYEYKTDGFIFTPMSPLQDNNTIFKWKPQEQNTIDFYVEIDNVKDQNNHEKLHLSLYVGSQSTTPKEYFSSKSNSKNSYIAKLFKPDIISPYNTHYTILDIGEKCLNGDDLRNKAVIEMYFKDGKWKPYSIRHDKTELAYQTKSVTANNYKTAVNIWKTILHPVEKDHLIGNKNVEIIEDDIDANGKYYAKSKDRTKISSYPISQFHNHFVKTKFTFEKLKGKKSAFDMACGKGGDLYKFFYSGFTTVIGVDLNEDNIMNINDGVYTRLANMNIKDKDYAFVPMDSSSKYGTEEQIDKISDPYTRNLARCIWGQDDSSKYDKGIQRFFNIANDKFDLVTCQFAIHYFFESKDKLQQFCKNVNSLLKKGGYFTGTCFDGEKVHELLNKNNGIAYATEENKEDAYIWKIDRKYDNKTIDKNKYGNTIDVYINSINKTHPEYLVNYEELVKELDKYNIRPINDKDTLDYNKPIYSFEEIYRIYSDDDTLPVLDTNLKTFSFLNMWFMFKKF